MNEDMPWVNLTQEEVEELRNKKHELTEYGKQRLKELMNKDLTFKTNGKETFSIPSQTLENLTLGTKTPETQLEVKEMTHEEMLEEAERREKEVEENIQRAIEVDKEIEEAALKAVEKLYEENGDALKRLAEIEKEERERPFYRFFAIEYFATGEGMSFWLKVCRNYDIYDGKDYDLERFVKFVGDGAEFYMHGFTEPTEEQFMSQYSNLIPPYIVKMIERRDQPCLDWETHFHFNYS